LKKGKNMNIIIEKVETCRQRKQFVQLPFDIYKGNSFWVPSLKSDDLKSIKKETNPAFEFCEAEFWLAKKDGKTVGRIGAIINKAYNQQEGKNFGRFSRFECIDDQEVANQLLKTAEIWCKEKGMTHIHGPLGFSNLDLQGMLVEGFDYLASIASVYHHPYYQKLIENYGFIKEIDWVEFRLTVGTAAQTKAERGAEIVRKRFGIETLHFNSKSELIPYGPIIFKILNDAFDVLPYVSPFSDKMIEYYSKKYMNFLNPRFVKMAIMNGEPIGFLIGLPSLSEAMQKANGKLFPFGIFPILKARKGNSETMDQMLTGVVKEHQATGAAVLLMAEIQKEMLSHGMKFIETTGIFETNEKAISNWKNYEHIQHKRKRCFVKAIL
jgi:hypothetical protein